jgi:nicotinamidase-related amidase
VLIERSHAQILVVDMQERLLPAMVDADDVLKRAIILAKAARTLGLPIAVSEQYPRGLGHTVQPLKDEIGNAPVYEKLEFSCWKNGPLRDHLAETGRRQVVVAGIEAHVCVLQSALDLKQAGFDVFTVADAVSSRSDRSRELAQSRLRHADIQVVNTEMVVFEALGAAGSAEFKTLSALIR